MGIGIISAARRRSAGGGSGLSTQWRIYIYQQLSGSDFPVITEIELRSSVGGSNIASGGTATASSTASGHNAADPLDGSTSTSWQANDFCPAWWQYTFASSVTINEVAITIASGLYPGAPTWFDVQYYDGANWVTYFTGFAAGWVTGLGKRVFNATTSTLGTERVTDPGFDTPAAWAASGGWSVSGSNAIAASAANRLAQTGILTSGKSYAMILPYTKTAGSKLRITSEKGPRLFLSPGLNNVTATLYPTFVSDGSDLRLEADTSVLSATFPSISVKEFTEALGPERVTDPGFDNPASWTTSGGWSISGSNAVGSSAGDRLKQSGVFVSGKPYRVLFNYTMTTGAKLRIRTEANNNIYLSPSLNTLGGCICAYVIADGTELRIEADTNFFTGTIPSISVKEVL